MERRLVDRCRVGGLLHAVGRRARRLRLLGQLVGLRGVSRRPRVGLATFEVGDQRRLCVRGPHELDLVLELVERVLALPHELEARSGGLVDLRHLRLGRVHLLLVLGRVVLCTPGQVLVGLAGEASPRCVLTELLGP